MFVDIRYWENDVINKYYVIVYFNVWNVEMLMGVIDVVEEVKLLVIIFFGIGFVGNILFEDFFYMMVLMV